MKNFTEVIVFGRDHELEGEIYSQTLDASGIALATSAGVTSKPNEDAIGASALNHEDLLAIADGHWGKEASEVALSRAMEILRPETDPASEIQSSLFSLYEQINTQLYDLAASASDNATPETTLIVCRVRETQMGKELHWSSFGDSYLFLMRDRQLRQLNTLYSRWLGYYSKLSENAEARSTLMRLSANEARFVGVAEGLDAGMENLLPGDIVFLCTDGLVGSDRRPARWILDELQDILNSDLPLGEKAEKLIAFALARGEKDNISCVFANM